MYAVASRLPLSKALLGYLLSITIPLATAPIRFILDLPLPTPNLLEPALLVAMLLGVAARARAGQRAALTELVNTRIERAAVTERNRITAEMHDVVAHSVTVMGALAGGARAGWQKHPERALEALEQLGNVGTNVLDEMQVILRILREGDAGLGSALHVSGYNLPNLQELIDTFRAADLPVTLTQHGNPADHLALQNTVYRVVQESLTNALRYARDATSVAVEITGNRTELRITVTDNGRPEYRQPSIGAGVGLSAMSERAAAFGGTHQAGPLPDGGWRTETVLPLSPEFPCGIQEEQQ